MDFKEILKYSQTNDRSQKEGGGITAHIYCYAGLSFFVHKSRDPTCY